MVLTRSLEADDLSLLEQSLATDEYHQGTAPEFFVQPGTVCNVYEDEQGPVAFVRGTKSLRIDVQFVNNKDFARNRVVVTEGLQQLIDSARDNGFTEVVFNSDSRLLIRFCKRTFGFQEVAGELRKLL